MAEFWDIYDRDRRLTGRTLRRGDAMTREEYHLVVRVWIRSGDGRWLISRRAPEKTFPGQWESTIGSALAGETSLEAALREAKEELGVCLVPEKGRLVQSVRRDDSDRPDFLDIWVFEHDCSLTDVTLQPGETTAAQWVTGEEILQMMTSGVFVPFEQLGPWKIALGMGETEE